MSSGLDLGLNFTPGLIELGAPSLRMSTTKPPTCVYKKRLFFFHFWHHETHCGEFLKKYLSPSKY